MDHKRRIITNTAANAAAQVIAMVASLVFMPLLVRAFGLQDFGLYMLATTISGYTIILDFGVGTTVQKRVAEYDASGRQSDIGEIVSSAFITYLLVGVLSSLVILGIAAYSQALFRLTPHGAQLLRTLLFVTAAQSLLAWPLSVGQHVLAGLQRHTLVARTTFLISIGTVLAIIGTLAAGQGPFTMYVATTLVLLAGATINTLQALQLLAGVPLGRGHVNKAALHAIFSLSWPVFVIQFLSMVLYQQTDRLVLMAFVGATAVGLYEAVGKFQGLVVQTFSMTSAAVMPMAARLDAQQHESGIRTLFIRGTKLALVVVTPIVAALIIFARPLLLHWLGPAYLTVATAAQLMISHQLLTAGTGVGDGIIMGRGLLSRRLPYVIAIAAGNLAISIMLVHSLGILGVVLGTAIPYFIEFPLHIRFLLREIDVPVARWLREVVAPVYPLLAVPVVVGLGLLRTPLVDSLIGVAICMMLTIGSYWVAVFTLALSDVEKGEVRALLQRARARLGSRG